MAGDQFTAPVVKAAVSTLFGPVSGQQHHANEFLSRFAASPEAWEVCLVLLREIDTSLAPAVIEQIAHLNACILHDKVRKQWGALPHEHRGAFAGRVVEILQAVVQQQLAMPARVVRQVCLTLAATAVRSETGPDAFMTHALQFAQVPTDTGTAVALEMLQLLPQEVQDGDLTHSRKKDLDAKLAGFVDAVLQVCAHVLGDPAQQAAHGEGALLALSSWARLGVSLNRITQEHRALCGGITASLGSGAPGLAVGASKAVESMVNAHAHTTPTPAALAWGRAALMNTSGMLAATSAALACEGEAAGATVALDADTAETVSLAIAAACETFGEVYVEELCGPGACEDDWNFITFMLALTTHPFRKVGRVLLEFWLFVGDLPTSERHPAVGEVLFPGLLQALLQMTAYPAGFTTWDDFDGLGVDADIFKETREASEDILSMCFGNLRATFMSSIAGHITEAEHAAGGPWQPVEVALFAAHAVANRATAKVEAHLENQPVIVAQRMQYLDGMAGLLQRTIARIGDPAHAAQHPAVVASGLRLLGSYAVLAFARPVPMHQLLVRLHPTPEQLMAAGITAPPSWPPLLEPMLAACVRGLAIPGATTPAAQALKSFCVNARRELLLHTLHTECQVLSQFIPASIAGQGTRRDREILVETAARTLAGLVESPPNPSAPVKARQWAAAFAQPLIGTVQSSIAAGVQARDSLEEALALIAKFCSFLELPMRRSNQEPTFSDGTHMLAPVVQVVWPLLEQVVGHPTLCQDEEVVAAAFDVYQRLVVAAKDVVAPHITSLVGTTVQLFERQRWPSALDCVAVVLETFGAEIEGGGLRGAFTQLVGHLCTRSIEHIQAGHPPTEEPELVASLFNMLQMFVLWCPTTLLESPDLDTTSDLMIACVDCLTDRPALNEVLTFVRALLALSTDPRQQTAFQAVVVPLFMRCGPRLVLSLFRALATPKPKVLRSPLSECLNSLMCVVGMHPTSGPCHAWAFAALADQTLSQGHADLEPATKERLMQAFVVYTSDPSMKRKNKMTLEHYGAVCNGEMKQEDLATDVAAEGVR